MAEINSNYEKMPKLGKVVGGPQRFLPHEKPKNAKSTIARVMKMLLMWRKSMIIAVILTILSSSIAIIVPLLLGKAINTFDIKTGSVDTMFLFIILISLVSCYLTGFVIDTCNGVLMTKVTQKLVKQIRFELFAKLQRIPLNFYDTRSHGDTMSRVTNDVDNISGDYFLEQQTKLGELNGIIEENLVGLKMVKAFNRQQSVMDEFKKVNGELKAASTNAQIWAGFMMPFMNVINNISFAIIACVGGIMSVNGTLTIGLVVSFLAYSKQFGQPLNNIAGMFNNIQSALAGAERVFELLDETEEIPDKSDAKNLSEVQGKVEFRDVAFSYTPRKPMLRNISFTVQPGEVIALVGETGAGKTTIVNLLLRFYELDSGYIFIDDNEIRDISKKMLRDCFSVVLQDSFLFTGTIYDNIRYSRPTSSDEEVINAAKLARADDFIMRLTNGYNTIVAGSSDNLNLGQRQLIAIARAILCNAPILILDEATSSVDTKTEKEIQHALLTLMKSHTSFLIAHRLSTIRDADKIMVIGDGKILETGTHDELMLIKGSYYEMVMSQLGLNEKDVKERRN